MVAIAVEMCKLLNHLMSSGQGLIIADDLDAVCENLSTKAEELASLTTALTNVISENRYVIISSFKILITISACV